MEPHEDLIREAVKMLDSRIDLHISMYGEPPEELCVTKPEADILAHGKDMFTAENVLVYRNVLIRYPTVLTTTKSISHHIIVEYKAGLDSFMEYNDNEAAIDLGRYLRTKKLIRLTIDDTNRFVHKRVHSVTVLAPVTAFVTGVKELGVWHEQC